jgi:multiple sugar transport system substrate-binding protein
MRITRLVRRGLLACVGIALLAGVAQAQKAAPITIVINQSPWFASFRAMVELYEKETGNKVELDVNPFAGSLEKQRNSVRAGQGQYDVLIMNSGWFAEMYHGGFVQPITDVDPAFKLDPQIYTFDDTVCFDAAKKSLDCATGKLMAMPVNPNIPLLFYRADLYKEKGLAVPRTWDELYANAKALHAPPRIYGISQRGARGPHSVAYDWYPYLYGFGGSIFKDQDAGDFTVTINSPAGKAALDYYVRLANEVGHPKTAAQDQAEVIQNLVTGKAAHAIVVIAAWPQFEDPTKSIVVGKLDVAVPPSLPGRPSAPGLGHWLAGISRNVPAERQKAAVELFRWFQQPRVQLEYTKAGGAPVSAAPYQDAIAKDPKQRWMPAMAEGAPLAVNIYTFPEAGEVIAILELEINRAVAGEVTTTAALNTMADQIAAVMGKHGYRTGKLAPLP